VILPDGRLLIPTAMTFMLQSVASVLSCRLILHLRAYVRQGDGGELMSMSVGPGWMGSIEFVDVGMDGGQSGGCSDSNSTRSGTEEVASMEDEDEIIATSSPVGTPV